MTASIIFWRWRQICPWRSELDGSGGRVIQEERRRVLRAQRRAQLQWSP
jgi:hypothetical protein